MLLPEFYSHRNVHSILCSRFVPVLLSEKPGTCVESAPCVRMSPFFWCLARDQIRQDHWVTTPAWAQYCLLDWMKTRDRRLDLAEQEKDQVTVGDNEPSWQCKQTVISPSRMSYQSLLISQAAWLIITFPIKREKVDFVCWSWIIAAGANVSGHTPLARWFNRVVWQYLRSSIASCTLSRSTTVVACKGRFHLWQW